MLSSTVVLAIIAIAAAMFSIAWSIRGWVADVRAEHLLRDAAALNQCDKTKNQGNHADHDGQEVGPSLKPEKVESLNDSDK